MRFELRDAGWDRSAGRSVEAHGQSVRAAVAWIRPRDPKAADELMPLGGAPRWLFTVNGGLVDVDDPIDEDAIVACYKAVYGG